MVEVAIIVLGCALGLIAASAVHELGHALGLWLCGRRVLLVQIGSGRSSWAWPPVRPRVLLSWSWPLGGRCVSQDRGRASRGAQVIEGLAGSGSNLLCAAALLLGAPGSGPLFVVAWMHIAVALSQLLPLPGHDGAVVLSLLSGRDACVGDGPRLDDEHRWLQRLGHRDRVSGCHRREAAERRDDACVARRP